ncbi:zinc finger HIT domain-containing protein 2-like [Rhopilema esculentum]|uniref:zinc finger HIT domain-containing protein 2-like n=1 Tax=Rhopilema esculentum TaxID=499914 RepID=UPI0031DC7843|eukprot:gene17668-9318_t
MATDNNVVKFDLRVKDLTNVNDFENHPDVDSSKRCKFCKVKESKYTCPKCNCHYCGLGCYKSKDHEQCSETFYKENVLRELKGMKSTDKLKRETMEMLNKMKKERNSDAEIGWDDEATEGLEVRMQGLDIDNANFEDIFVRLTEKEKQLFDEIIAKGEVEIAELVTPWWRENLYKGVEEMNGEKKVNFETNRTPRLLQKIEPLNILLPNKVPSPVIPFNICEVIITYCFVYRLYNGELQESTQEALDTILELSPVMKDSHYYTDVEYCLRLFVQRVKSSVSLKDALDPVHEPFDDLFMIISSYSWVELEDKNKKLVATSVLCVSDLHSLFKNAAMELTRTKNKTKEEKEKKKLYQKVTKKLYFLASWLVENQHTLSCLEGKIKDVKSKVTAYWEGVKEERKEFETFLNEKRNNTEKQIIEEL